ncbi:hypothetical protein I6A60_02015 [Frankia sp. AgB1.9]|uniref:hypothetical protein n=1 Tax=unclassified Frankia TaxID=2632575 RepID=UPI0019328CA0|nr:MULTISPECIES: hypothetical protein [unclassified Frankia]MBL7490472.1 hypothetical protein [Frankia sp. AgW1.1]MBL7546662.1 hypothetical protein [Frankia sp. AgB1.9]MBL7618183.1 hypothetical protein [Frankia sp. AgB1.8]
MIFHLHMRLDVAATPPGADLFEAADRFMEELHALGDQDGRRDCTVGVELRDRSSGSIEVDLDVEAEKVETAFAIAMSWLRAALHAAGVPTPGWDLGPIQIDPLASLARA